MSMHIKSQRDAHNFFIWPRGASGSIFEVKSLSNLEAGGNVRS